MTNFFNTDGACFLSRLFKSSFFIPLLLICFSSCSITKQGNYFKNITRDTTINLVKQDVAELKIKKGDALNISISSLNKAEDDIYNAPASAATAKAAGASSGGVMVDGDGYIFIHKLGKVKAEGLTRKELKLFIENEFLPYLKDPIVAVNFGNHHVTVIGEIGSPQILSLSEDRISIIDVLAQSGSITQVTQLDNIMIIREKENTKEFRHVNLEDHSIFTSPYYYLQPNDVVVISQNEKIVKELSKREKYQQYSSVILQALSVAILIYQVFFRK
jgi:polysaccharide biosynthesis/export protein